MSDSLLANAAVLQAFGTNDLATADYLSRRTGQATIDIRHSFVAVGIAANLGLPVLGSRVSAPLGAVVWMCTQPRSKAGCTSAPQASA